MLVKCRRYDMVLSVELCFLLHFIVGLLYGIPAVFDSNNGIEKGCATPKVLRSLCMGYEVVYTYSEKSALRMSPEALNALWNAKAALSTWGVCPPLPSLR